MGLGDNQVRVYGEFDPQPVAVGAHSVRIVKAEKRGTEFKKDNVAMGTFIVLAEQDLLTALQVNNHTAVSSFEGGFNRVSETLAELCQQISVTIGNNKPVNNKFDGMGPGFFQEWHGLTCLQLDHFSINKGVGVAVAKGLFQQIGVCSLAITHNGSQQLKTDAGNQGRELIGNLKRGLWLHGSTALGTMTHADVGEKHAQVVIYLSNGAHGGAWISAYSLLLGGNSRIKPEDVIHLRLFHLIQESTGKSREALHVATLAFGVECIES